MPTPHRPQRYVKRRRRPALHWSSFAAGIVCGGLLTFVGALLPGLFGAPAVAAGGKSDADAPAVKGAKLVAAPTPPTPKFEFFESLPKTTISTPLRPDASNSPAATRRDVEYLLQAGSFVNREDADKLSAFLAPLGFAAETSSAVLADGAARFRVLVGPYSGDQDLRRAIGKLREQNLAPLPIARKPGAG